MPRRSVRAPEQVAAVGLQTEGASIMWWPTFLTTIFPRPVRGARATPNRRAPRRLTLEALESRDVPSYAVTDLGVNAGFDGSYASALNQAGDVAGYETASAGVAHAVL
jgi:hypothetical protein